MTAALVTATVAPDLRAAVDSALLWGAEAVVLRTVGRGRVPDVNEARVRALLEEAETPAVAVDPGLFEGPADARAMWLDDLESLAALAPFCRRLGCETVIVGPLAGADREANAAAEPLRRAGDAAARHGLRLAVRNDGAAPEAAALADLVAAVDHEAVLATWSVAASRRAGEDSARAAAALAGRPLALVEADEAFALAPPEASGLLALARGGFSGPVALAFGGVPEDGLGTTTALVRSIRQARRALREGAGA